MNRERLKSCSKTRPEAGQTVRARLLPGAAPGRRLCQCAVAGAIHHASIFAGFQWQGVFTSLRAGNQRARARQAEQATRESKTFEKQEKRWPHRQKRDDEVACLCRFPKTSAFRNRLGIASLCGFPKTSVLGNRLGIASLCGFPKIPR